MPQKKETAVKKSGASGAASGAKAKAYDASSITVLEGLDPVRKRPGMYIGTTGPDGLHHLIWEVFDNSRDEAMGGFADDIEVALLPGNRIRVVDNGRGIPVDKHPMTKVSALETIMTTLHAGGKFGGDASGYKVSGGLHGVGVSVVNALSVYARAEVHRDGASHFQEYKIGKAQSAVKKIGASSNQGTIITFEADPAIFSEIKYDWNRIVAHLRQQAYLVKGTRITVIDARGPEAVEDKEAFYLRELALEVPSMTFYFEGGLRSLVSFYNQHQTLAHKNIFYVDGEKDGVMVEAALQYTDDITPKLMAFANNIYNPEHGTHVTGFKTALTRTLNSYGRSAGILKESEENFTGDDVLEGITAVISIKMPEIQFEGQTKGKLGSVEAQGATATVFGDAFSSFLEENPDDARSIINKVLLALKARKAAKAAKDSVLRKGALEGMTLPGKLADCQSKDPAESELFVVEGDSAGGCFSGDTKVALVDGRDASFADLVREDAEGKKNYCYTIANDGTIAIAPIMHPRVTKKDAQVIKIVLDSDEEIICTPDHRFMIRDGSYKEAKDLTSADSLMPLRRKISKIGGRITIKGYEMVYSPAESFWIFTHLLSDRFNLARGAYQREENQHVHHRNYHKLDNHPDNLVRLDREEHLQHHREHLEHTLHSEVNKERARQAHKTPEYKEKALKTLSDIWQSLGVVDETAYEARRKETKDETLLRFDTIISRFFNNDRVRLEEAVAHFNHRIVRIESMTSRMDVYDIEVPGTHNFALASGVFVHNSSKMGRDRRTQAILPLRGKILNIERARLDKMLASEQIKNLVIALGTAIGDVFDISKLRYHKIIIATDADVDGAHIRTLLLTLLYRHFRAIIDGGFVYIAQPPLYKIKRGKEIHYAYTDEQKFAVVGKDAEVVEESVAEVEPEEGEEAEEGTKAKKKTARWSIQRYKGLGEMNASELWETTMDPSRRILKQVHVEDAAEADRIFDILMGNDVASRKSFIQSNAKLANLDV